MSLHPEIVSSYKEALTLCENWIAAAAVVQADVSLKTSRLAELEAVLAAEKAKLCEVNETVRRMKDHTRSCHMTLINLKRFMLNGDPWSTRSVDWHKVAEEIDKLTGANTPPKSE